MTEHRGQFKKGNPGGPGNPKLALSGIIRDAFKSHITPARAKALVERIDRMVDSDDDKLALAAFQEIADRIGGKPSDSITVQELEALQAKVEELTRVVATLSNR